MFVLGCIKGTVLHICARLHEKDCLVSLYSDALKGHYGMFVLRCIKGTVL